MILRIEVGFIILLGLHGSLWINQANFRDGPNTNNYYYKNILNIDDQ